MAPLVLSLLPVRGPNLVAHVSLSYATTAVRVLVDEDFPDSWRVWQAELRENLISTWGYLEVQNISAAAVETSDFYAEYFDGSGRACFSLAFSQEHNVAQRTGPFAPGETRQLYSLGASLAPACEVKELRLHLLRQKPRRVPGATAEPDTLLRAPLTVNASSRPTRNKVRLGSELESAESPVLDLILARITVDAAGRLVHVDTLDAINAEVQSWFLEFVPELTFYPATARNVPESGDALVLVRAIVSTEDLGTLSLLPRVSPWVRSYVEHSTDPVPPITELLFQRPPTWAKFSGGRDWTRLPPTPPGLFEPMDSGSDWCPGIFTWVADPSSPHHLRRELADTDGQGR